ncbi:hypothetical protein QWY85_16530 [Neolewinella lacunae]|uniref:Uncharacterized protein n=1 Tax=Neolewinella lacunae TaxID=1517758 RepID=A0A923T806_9BACT|nr:hypothetical protein [Neolewinella lacunae]MBC6993448.1 hypothetical protein [Neolewinella lacunae]MDN3636276.1 hypothetical protein [Neolewinella lacunae]
MRFLLPFLLFLAAAPFLRAQSLAEFDAGGADLATFSEVLADFMNGSDNREAKDAYANFTGTFFGGGFTENQQRRIAATAVALAKLRVSATSGFPDYLGLLAYLTGTEGMEDERFAEFHDAFDQLLATPKVRANDILRTLNATNSFLATNKLGGGDSPEMGWFVVGGKPHFLYDGGVRMRIDTVRQLRAIGREDTLNIQETELLVDLANDQAYGKGGRTDWQRQGLSPDVFAILVSYSFDTKRLIYTSDSAHLQYPEYFQDEILVGSFSDKVQPGGARAGAEYPQFLSDDGFVEIQNVGEGIDLFGNFELRGNTVYAIGSKGRKAQVNLSIKGKEEGKSVKGLAQSFTIRQGERIGGQGVQTTIYVGKDSLYHPSVTMQVNIPERVVGLTRSESSSDQSPFFHSLNNLNIYADHIDIHLNGDSAVVGKKTVSFQEKSDVIFESKDFFSQREYDFVRDIAASNPLDVIYAYRNSPEGGNDLVSVAALARKFNPRFTVGDIRPLLYSLQTRGFLLYDPETETALLMPKIEHYVRASREEIDYDKIRLISRTADANAVLDLNTGQVRVDDVQPVEFNREKQIAIKPVADQLTITGDRDFDFSGEIYAGGMVFTGKNFHFKYAPYHIEMDSVRYFDLFLPVKDFIGEGMKRESTGSRIEHLSGYLLIDAPLNKSGTEDIAYFPSLQSKGTSYIFYDGADTMANYRRDSFYFELAPFSLNGLDSLLASQVKMDGRLYSGGIFPDMQETLSIQEDGSLGFITQTPEGGQGAYGDRGKYEGEVVLSNRGLEGKGRLTYLEANIDSEDLKFQLDKTTASARSFALEESVAGDRVVPQVSGTEVNIEFKPYGDSLIVNSVAEAPFAMFKAGGHEFDGGLVLTPEALKGNGTLGWAAASMKSKDMDFMTFGARADTANVAIKSINADDRLALSTSNVRADVNFDTQIASFENNSTELSTSLPYNQFKTSIDRFDWDMAGGNITFQAEIGKDRFTSIHPDQDDLTFTGTAATYDINTSMLDVEGVPFIKSADAKIIPGDGKIRVESEAKITELTNAQIVADTLNEYHVINRATVQILGRKEYRASGFYEYNVGTHEQEVEFQDIVGTRIGKGNRNEKATATRANGEVSEATEFYVDHKTRFFGTINLDAGSKTLLFDGYAKIEAEKLPGAQWFTVRSEGDRKNLTLRVEQPKDREGLPLFTGIYLSKPNRVIYPSLVQTLDFRKDHPILDCNGLFTYDESRDVFLFGDSTRIYNPESIGGNLMQFDNAKGKISGDGLLGLGGRLKYVSVKSYGTVAMDMPATARRAEEPEPEVEEAPETEKETPATPNMFLLEEEIKPKEDTTAAKASITIEGPVAAAYPDVKVKAMMAIDLILPDKLVNMMATDLISGAYAAPGLNLVTDRAFFQAGLHNLFPAGKDRQDAEASLAAAVLNVPRKINEHTFLFSQMSLQWSNDYQSFVTTEKLSGLASIKGNPLSKMMEVHAEIKMPTGGDDRLYLYIKSPSELYYFFGFKDGVLNVVSNNTQFMAELEGMKAKDLVLKMPDGETYEILPVSPGTAQTFLRRVEEAFKK